MANRMSVLGLAMVLGACGGHGGAADSCPETRTSGSEASAPSGNHVAAPQSVADLSGTWQTQWGDVPDLGGGGDSVMEATNRQDGLILTYGEGHTMACAMDGARCIGSWVGGTGSGWFDVTFDAAGTAFAGTWGYGPVRGASGTFEGRR